MDSIATINDMRWDSRIDRSANLSALSLFLWDYCLTFPEELHYFWGARWSFVKLLFFVNRYFTFVLVVFSVFFDVYSTPASSTCLVWAQFEVFTTLFCAFVVEVVMQVRLYALYGHDKRVIFVVSMLCLGELMSMVSLSIAKFDPSLAGLAQVPGPDGPYVLPFCNNVIPNNFFPYWVAFMVFDVIILFLVARKAYNHYKMLPDRTWREASQTLLGVLARDSVFYFVCNVAVFLGTTFLWRFGAKGLATIANSWSIVVPSTSAGRLMLNIRKAYKPSSDRISTAGLSGLGSLHIVTPPSGDRRRNPSTTDGGDTFDEEGDSYFDDDEY
ncbi:hypothetical protein C8F01DRAFT_782126 [Mycena amicta]|nr:hypothetical protein C8F01DRAFT_782126 [Mycena amicta]